MWQPQWDSTRLSRMLGVRILLGAQKLFRTLKLLEIVVHVSTAYCGSLSLALSRWSTRHRGCSRRTHPGHKLHLGPGEPCRLRVKPPMALILTELPFARGLLLVNKGG